MTEFIKNIRQALFKSKNQPHIYLHIHKSGGTSLMNCIDANYRKNKVYVIKGTDFRNSYLDFKNKPRSYRHEIDLLRGHHFFGSHEYLRNGAVYFTMLREPIARLNSLYNYLKAIDLYREINELEMDFGEFLESGLAMAADNGMTRMLTNNDFDKIPNGKIPIELADEAIYNLRNKFEAVGITEEFEASLKLFKAKLGWHILPNYGVDNVTLEKVTTPQEINSFFEKDKEKQRFIHADIKVYEYVKDKFYIEKEKL